ncbi:DNA-directed RNA polymerase subunit L [Candidatus Woesearchaeota archaeon]|nr:DNA-directed RNA polymerase subunit L [Candidatus Woesearchaeota archaeon]
MEVKILEDKKKRIVLELEGEDHTFCNLIKKELWNDSHVKVAAYNIDHPMIGKPKMIVETDGGDPRKALTDAAKRVEKDLDKFKSEFSKNIK